MPRIITSDAIGEALMRDAVGMVPLELSESIGHVSAWADGRGPRDADGRRLSCATELESVTRI